MLSAIGKNEQRLINYERMQKSPAYGICEDGTSGLPDQKRSRLESNPTSKQSQYISKNGALIGQDCLRRHNQQIHIVNGFTHRQISAIRYASSTHLYGVKIDRKVVIHIWLLTRLYAGKRTSLRPRQCHISDIVAALNTQIRAVPVLSDDPDIRGCYRGEAEQSVVSWKPFMTNAEMNSRKAI